MTDNLDIGRDIDVVLLDPPRDGAKQVCQALVQAPCLPAKILYVSCNPATFARDAKQLGSCYQLSYLG